MADSNPDGNKLIIVEEYYLKNYQQVFGYIYKKINNQTDAEDLAMDAFTSCIQNIERYDPQKASFQTWFYIILNRKLYNYFRDRKEFDEIDESMIFADSFEDDVVAAEHLKEMRKAVAEAIDTLTDVQKSIVLMKYFDGMKAEDIGRELGMKAATVRTNLSRAQDKLRVRLDSFNEKWKS